MTCLHNILISIPLVLHHKRWLAKSKLSNELSQHLCRFEISKKSSRKPLQGRTNIRNTETLSRRHQIPRQWAKTLPTLNTQGPLRGRRATYLPPTFQLPTTIKTIVGPLIHYMAAGPCLPRQKDVKPASETSISFSSGFTRVPIRG